MILEIGIGHKERGSAPASFAAVNRKWEWLGWWQIIFVMFGIVLYYTVIISWCFNYLIFSFNLSWGNDPNTFFLQNFLHLSNSPTHIGSIRTEILFSLGLIWLINWIIVFRGVEKGLEKANKFFMPLLFLLTSIITIWSLFLPGAKEGIITYLKPDLSKLADIRVWMDGFSQIFFTLSLGFGIIIAYASYLPRKTEIVKDAITISLVNCFFSLIVGLGIFSVLGYMAKATATPINQVVTESISLTFVAYPKAISMLPAFSNFFGVLFFGILVIAGLSSSISIIEAFTSGMVDKFNYSRKAVVSFLCVGGFLGSIIFVTDAGLIWIDIVDHFLTQYGLVFASILECFLLGWLFKISSLREHINHISSLRLPWTWELSIKIIAPIVLLVLLIQALIKDFSFAYGGYSLISLILIGRDWLIYTMFFAIIVSAKSWKDKRLD